MDKYVKVLIADGSEAFCEHLAELVRERGYEVAGVATDGIRAAELLRQTRPDFLILDLMLPRGDGVSVLKELPQEQRPKTLMLSAISTAYIASVTADCGDGSGAGSGSADGSSSGYSSMPQMRMPRLLASARIVSMSRPSASSTAMPRRPNPMFE